ncbi:hypothetical protein TrRE_jg9639 [Triparma retinervis]|uniref:Phosphoribosyl-AMP cyclohydrolase n=1 Tax=Triparma retinervis TaxID=2557542 RepID=A0A9W7F5C6_9STRA|nr:hypothetical protein TrRE_jg9639 [Triparma retinervis]
MANPEAQAQNAPVSAAFGLKGGAGEPLKTLTVQDVEVAQKAWGDAIVEISRVHKENGDFVAAAGKAAGELYGYGHFDKVIFKPTKAAAYPFRPTANEAMSYFVGGSNVPNGYSEDAGFAINGGSGWSAVVFNNHDVVLDGSSAVAMGEYLFTCATTGKVTKVEYSFGYRAIPDGSVRIWMHHSSVPYQG